MKTTDHGFGRTTISTAVLERLWVDAVRQQIRDEIVR